MKSVTTLLIATTLVSSISFAQSTPSTPAPAAKDNRGSDKVDLKKLEDKYWSAKDDDYGVIQNRTFAKAGKFYLSAVYGPLVNDPFAKSKAAGAMLGYYFTEDFGVEASYLNYNSSKSETVDRFNTLAANTSPNYNLQKSAVALSATYTPFYAKMAFMNKAILYFDMGFTLGAGMTAYDQVVLRRNGITILGEDKIAMSAPHFELGVMQQLFINKNLAFRLDIKNSFYSQKVKEYNIGTTETEDDRGEETKSTNDTTITFGVTLFTN